MIPAWEFIQPATVALSAIGVVAMAAVALAALVKDLRP